MAAAQCMTYLKFLAYDHAAFCSGDAEAHNTPRSTAFHGHKVGYGAEVYACALAHQVGKFLDAVAHSPAVEIYALAVVVVEHLREHALVGRVAESLGRRLYPCPGTGFVAQVGIHKRVRSIAAHCQIAVVHRLPAVLEQFEHAAAAFAETGVGKFAAVGVGKSYAGRGVHGFGYCGSALACHALIALAVVVGAHVEVRMVFTVLPTHYLIVGHGTGVICRGSVGYTFVLAYLCKQPRTRDYGMRPQ